MNKVLILLKMVFHKAKMLVKKLDNSMNKYRTNEAVFTKVYRKRKWNSKEINNAKYDSGFGSDKKFTNPYVQVVSKFIIQKNIKSVIDLGCGDFRVGSQIIIHSPIKKYIGVDIVQNLIDFLSKNYKDDIISFVKKDITKDNLPFGDLYLVRQVFQHLSNEDIQKSLKNIPSNAHLLVTEHQFIDTSRVIPNIDKIRGSGIRLYNNSGVYLDKKPFNLNLSLLFQTNINEKECIRVFQVLR